MADPVNAARVVAHDVRRRFPSNPDVVCGREGHAIVDALLAYGDGDPVVLMRDGTMRRLIHVPSTSKLLADPVRPEEAPRG